MALCTPFFGSQAEKTSKQVNQTFVTGLLLAIPMEATSVNEMVKTHFG